MTHVLEAAAHTDGDVMHSFWQGFPIAQECAAGELWDDDLWHDVGARRFGSRAKRVRSPCFRSHWRRGQEYYVFAGEFDAAAALIEEADTIAAATGYAPVRYHAISLSRLARRGGRVEAAARGHHRTCGAHRGEGRVVGLVGCMTAMLNNGLGHYEDALRAAKQACDHEDLGPYRMSLAELIEAGVRCGEREAALEAVALMETQASRRNGLGAGYPGALPSPGRRRYDCRGLLPRGNRSARAHQDARLSRARRISSMESGYAA